MTMFIAVYFATVTTMARHPALRSSHSRSWGPQVAVEPFTRGHRRHHRRRRHRRRLHSKKPRTTRRAVESSHSKREKNR